MKKRIGAAVVVTALAVMLSACLLSPGKFTSSLDMRSGGQFSFTYKGEIYLLALSKLGELGAASSKTETKVFAPLPCYDDDAKERKCTAAEAADQKKEWQDEQKAAADKSKKDADMAKTFLGGIDPSDPKAAEELAARLRRQAGFRTVVYKGDGLFDVDFAITGQLDHDFVFPTIERFTMANAFVQLSRRSDGTVRVDAPGFAPSAGGSPFTQLMQMGAAMGASEAAGKEGKEGAKDSPPKFPVPDGQFTLTTNGTILANNTDEGPQTDPQGQRLTWQVNTRAAAAPMALVRLGNK